MYIEFTLSQAENYGTPERPYWKQKGADYQLLAVCDKALYAAEDRQAFLAELVERARSQIQIHNEHFEQSLIDWALVDEDHYTDSELNQLELDGKITYWATEIERVT